MSSVGGTPATIAGLERRSPFVDFLVRLVTEKPLGMAGAIVLLIMLITGIFAPVMAPWGMNEIDFAAMLEGRSAEHLLGTDQIGRDVLSRLIFGARVSVIVGVSATTLNIVVAALIGVPSGFFGGKMDIVIQRFVDAWMAFPSLLLLITVMSLVGPGQLQIISVMGILFGVRNSRVVRSAVINIRENVYMAAAEAVGSTSMSTLARHVMPNITAPLIIVFTVTIGSVIMTEASLSFLGFGLPPEIASWGGMLSGEGRKYMELAPRLALWPGVALSIVIYSINMFGDAMRDLLDPRMRGGLGRYGTTQRKR